MLRYAHRWSGKVPETENDEDESGLGSLEGVFQEKGWKSWLVVSIREAQQRPAGVPKGRYDVDTIPRDRQLATAANSTRGLSSRKPGPSTWIAGQGLSHMEEGRTQLQRPASNNQVGITYHYHLSTCPTVLLH